MTSSVGARSSMHGNTWRRVSESRAAKLSSKMRQVGALQYDAGNVEAATLSLRELSAGLAHHLCNRLAGKFSTPQVRRHVSAV